MKKHLKTLVIFLLFIFLTGCEVNLFNKNSQTQGSNSQTIDETPEPQDQVYKMNFLATGDGLVHSVIHRAYLKNGKYDFTPVLENVKDIVSNYDIAYYNQETPMGDNTIAYGGYPKFYIPKEFGDAMIDAGFNMASLASNHSYDVGKQGILNTLAYFKTTDMMYDGMNETKERSEYQIKEKNNITYSFISYTTLDNGISRNIKYMANYCYSNKNSNGAALKDGELSDCETRLKKDIDYLRDKVDVLIVAMHWGAEYTHTPTAEQKKLAKFLADQKVDIVVGNHSHVLEPITKIGDTIVMYSLGNFVSNQYGHHDWNRVVGFMATLDITKTVHPDGTKEMTFDNVGGELIFTKYKGHPTKTSHHTEHTVIPFSKMDEDFVMNEAYKKDSTENDYKRVYKKYIDILRSMDMELKIAPLKESNN